MPQLQTKWPSVALLAICEVFALALWFSATAVIPALRAEFALGDLQASLFSSAVAVGFVTGTLISAVLGLSDRVDPRRLFMIAAFVAAASNALVLAFPPGSVGVIGMRFVTGICMAGLYPVGMKIAATWAKGDTGLLVGLLVGALTLGSAAPHLFNAAGGIDWRFTLIVASVFAAGSGVLITFVGLGPNVSKAPPFNPRAMLQAWTNKPLRLANLGYFGHMWELYAMWAWSGVFFHASLRLAIEDAARAALMANFATFAVVSAGAIGSLGAGVLADRMGRTTITMAAMAISGTCAAGIGLLFGGPPWALAGLAIVWGIAIVADSAQFSASVIELSEPKWVGTMLTVQTSVGFLITLVTIHLIPVFVDALTWRWAFAPLAIGPALGILAMARLRAHPEAHRLAGGNR
ncbi:MAG: MFS transporter [Alphaproteobacteria bacterium]|nr:MFS transporter [Alphaproteobacteria bacterium]